MQALSVSLLGDPQVCGPTGPVTCTSKKALGLFLFVAYSGRRHLRRNLAEMFWGGRNVDAARASLRTTLLRLPPAMAHCLSVDRESIQLRAAVDLDVHRFMAAAQGADIDSLREAAALYRGPLLANVDLDATAEFDDWLVRERARLQQTAQQTFDRLIVLHRERARADIARAGTEREAALATALRWCQLEPATEAAHRWLIRLNLEMGRPDAARAQFESCRRELAVATGRSPGPETLVLVEALMHGGSAVPAPPATRFGEVPIGGLPGTSFVGRTDELAELDRLLAEPACRLLTLQALGGTGKSRLASVLADQVASRFAQGVAWVALDVATTAAQVPQAIAQALGIDLPAHAAPADALCAALRSQERLLVLDNMEHLLCVPGDADVVGGLLKILQQAPGVRLLVTSREVLGVQEEWIYELQGLRCPDGETDAYAAGKFTAADLFAQRARQAYAGFSVQAEWPHIVRLCRLVEGLPLALELAAAWVRTIPCGDLVGAIQKELQSLPSRHRNRPGRHNSLDAVVQTSWTLLNAEQQRALAPLCVFVGGFTQEAATAVADAPLRVMSALVDKSLVRRRSGGRLDLHEMVRQFLRQRLSGEAEASLLAVRRHAAYFADLLQRCRSSLDGRQGTEANATLGIEMPNLLAAAPHWPIESDGESIIEAWLRVLSGRSLFSVARPFADRVLSGEMPLTNAVRVSALMHRGVAHVYFGDADRGEADLSSAIDLARRHGLKEALAAALVQSALVGFIRDDPDRIETPLTELQPWLGTVEDVGVRVRANYYRGLLLDTQGRLIEAEAQLARTEVEARELGVSEQLVAIVQSSLAQILARLGRLDAAEAMLRQVVGFFERAGQLAYLARSLNALAAVILWRSDGAPAAEAAEAATRALTLFEQLGSPYGISGAADTLGQARWAQGRVDEARALFDRAAASSSPLLENEAKVHLAMLCLESGQRRQAAEMAIERIDAARKHGLGAIRRSATMLAAMVVLATDRTATRAFRWLHALLAESDLDLDVRWRAERLLAEAGMPLKPPEAGLSPPAIDDAEWHAMREAIVRSRND